MIKRIIIYYCKNEDNKLNNYISIFLNSKIQQINGKFYYLTNNTNEEISIEFNLVNFYDEDFFVLLCNMLKISYIQALKITKEPCGPFDEEKMYSEIWSYAIHCTYEQPNSVFDFAANMFFRYLTGHKMQNGNKRLSLLFLINIMRHFGYHFYWSKGTKTNYMAHEKQVEKWVQLSQQYCSNYKEKLLDDISEWIKKNCVIALSWR